MFEIVAVACFTSLVFHIDIVPWCEQSTKDPAFDLAGYTRDVTKTGNGEWGMGNGEWGMGNGEWGMGNGQWAMGNGEWAMGNGQWAMGNGQWAMGNGQWEIEKWENIKNIK